MVPGATADMPARVARIDAARPVAAEEKAITLGKTHGLERGLVRLDGDDLRFGEIPEQRADDGAHQGDDQGRGAGDELEPLISELIPINYAVANDIAKLLKSIKAVEGPFSQNTSGNPFSSISVNDIPTESNSLLSERGNVTVDKRTNSILIQDTPSKIREVKKLIAQLDQPVKQVLIETRIV